MEADLLLLKWNSHKATFFQVLSSLRKKEAFTDATIACEGKLFPVHKLVLSTCSEYFGDIFEKTSCISPVVILKDIKHEELETLLDYMYLGEVSVNQADLASIIKAAECLQIKGLILQDVDLLSESTKRHYVSRGTPSKRLKAEISSKQANRHYNNSVHFKSIPFPDIIDRSSSLESSKESDLLEEEESILIPVTSMKLEIEGNQFQLDSVVSKDTDGEHSSDEDKMSEDILSHVSEPPATRKKIPSVPGTSGISKKIPNSNHSFGEADSDNKDTHLTAQQCPICHKNIKNLHNFQVHIRSHVERKLHICQYCPYSSMKVSDIQKHVRIHTGEKPYPCPYCPFRFSRSYHLKRHLLRIHTNQSLNDESSAGNANKDQITKELNSETGASTN